MTNKRNKEQLCHILTDYLISDEIVARKNNFVTKGRLCFMKSLGSSQQLVDELNSAQMEADHMHALS